MTGAFEMNGEQHPARLARQNAVKHAGTQHENALRVQFVGLPSGFTLGFNRERAIENVNCDQTISLVVVHFAARFKGEKHHRRRVAMKNRHLAVAVRSQMRFIEQMGAQIEQVEGVLRPTKTGRGSLAQPRRFRGGEKMLHDGFIFNARTNQFGSPSFCQICTASRVVRLWICMLLESEGSSLEMIILSARSRLAWPKVS